VLIVNSINMRFQYFVSISHWAIQDKEYKIKICLWNIRIKLWKLLSDLLNIRMGISKWMIKHLLRSNLSNQLLKLWNNWNYRLKLGYFIMEGKWKMIKLWGITDINLALLYKQWLYDILKEILTSFFTFH
jgi:hypothetical protein